MKRSMSAFAVGGTERESSRTLKNERDMVIEDIGEIHDEDTVRDSEISPLEEVSEENTTLGKTNEGRDRILSPEKEELVNSVILLQETLVDISTKVKVVEQQNAESQKEIDVLQLYVDNMMAKISAVKNVSTEL